MIFVLHETPSLTFNTVSKSVSNTLNTQARLYCYYTLWYGQSFVSAAYRDRELYS